MNNKLKGKRLCRINGRKGGNGSNSTPENTNDANVGTV